MLLHLLAQQSNTSTSFFIGGGLILVVALVLGFGASVFWIWMLVDCLVSRKKGVEKLIWLLVIFFGHIFGALLYFFVGRSNSAV